MVTASDANPELDIALTSAGEEVNRTLALVVREHQGVVYTNAMDIPLSGQIADLEAGRQVEVEIFVNGNSMGTTPVDDGGGFKLD